MDSTEQQEIDPNTLQLVHEEAKYAFERLIEDITALDEKLVKQIDISLIVIGVLLAATGTDWMKSFSLGASAAIGGGIFFLAIIVLIIVVVRFRRWDYYSGTIFPHILQEHTHETPEIIRSELISSLASSYYYNYQAYVSKGRIAAITTLLQMIIFVFFIVTILAGAAHIF